MNKSKTRSIIDSILNICIPSHDQNYTIDIFVVLIMFSGLGFKIIQEIHQPIGDSDNMTEIATYNAKFHYN